MPRESPTNSLAVELVPKLLGLGYNVIHQCKWVTDAAVEVVGRSVR